MGTPNSGQSRQARRTRQFVATLQRLTRRGTVAATLTAMLALTGAAIALDLTVNTDPTIIHPLTPGSWVQYHDSPDATGSGRFNPFLRTQSNDGTQEGFNADSFDRDYQFDTKDDIHTTSLTIDDVTFVWIDTGDEPGPDTEVAEFVADWNEPNNVNDVLQLDDFQLYCVDAATAADAGNNEPFTAWGAAVYHMNPSDDPTIFVRAFDYQSGSGAGDFKLYIDAALLDGCTNLIVWTEWSETNGGFTEWGFLDRPELTISKTLDLTYLDSIDWDVTKSVTNLAADANAGNTATFDYTVGWTRTDTKVDWAASGTITVTNSGDVEATIPFVSDIEDELSTGDPVTIECPGAVFPVELDSGDSLACTYSASIVGNGSATTNAATVYFQDPLDGAWGRSETGDVSATTETSAGLAPGSEETVTPSDDNDYSDAYDQTFAATDASGGTTYSHDYACPTDPSLYADDGHHTYDVINTLALAETDDEASVTVTVNCYAPTVSKTASGTYEETHTWTIVKSGDETYNVNAGDSQDHDYDIDVTETVTDGNHTVTGEITITNPNPNGAMTVAVTDTLDTSEVATIESCDTNGTINEDGTITVAKGSSTVCGYAVADVGEKAESNTVAVFIGGVEYDSDTQSFDYTKQVVGFDSVSVTDSSDSTDPATEQEFGPFDGIGHAEYTETFSCSTNPADYDNGSYTQTITNTATIDETGQFDDSVVTLNCYAPTVTKTAQGTFEETHDWNITKDGDADYTVLAGEEATNTYTVTVTDDPGETNHQVSGQITVVNANPDASMTVTLSDSLTDGAFIESCNANGTIDTDGSITVAAGTSAVCDYSIAVQGAVANTAAVSMAGVEYDSDTVEVTYTKDGEVGPAAVTVTDTNPTRGPLNLGSFGDGGTAMYAETYTCPATADLYTDGIYEMEIVNTATIIETGAFDTATVNVTCVAPVISKSGTASWDRVWDWTIDKDIDVDDNPQIDFTTGEDIVGLQVNFGGSVATVYSVDVTGVPGDAINENVDWTVEVKNPSDTIEMDVWVSDDIELSCDVAQNEDDSYTLAASGVMTCTGSSAPDVTIDTLGDAATNTATVELRDADGVQSFTDSAEGEAAWPDTPANEVDDCVIVTDTVDAGDADELGEVCSDTQEDGAEFTYEHVFGGIDALCGVTTRVNVAGFTTDDNALTGDDTVTVDLEVFCGGEGCTYTIGYWRTHNPSFHGGASAKADETWETLGPLGEDEVFIDYDNSSVTHPADDNEDGVITYFEVLWAPPRGDRWIMLAKQYIGATLNIASGADGFVIDGSAGPEVQDVLAAAEAILFPEDGKLSSLRGRDGRDATRLAGILDAYNNGIIGPGHCSDDSKA